MKATALHFVSAIMCIMYISAIIGIDVHNDSHNGQTYVVSLLNGINCEDIHQDDHCLCEHHNECDQSDGINGQDKDCTDSLAGIDLTGTNSNKILVQNGQNIATNSFCNTRDHRTVSNRFATSVTVRTGRYTPPITQLRI